MRVAVANQQHHLEEQHAGRPHRRTAAEPWQNKLADQRLDLKKQEGASENRKCVTRHRSTCAVPICPAHGGKYPFSVPYLPIAPRVARIGSSFFRWDSLAQSEAVVE